MFLIINADVLFVRYPFKFRNGNKGQQALRAYLLSIFTRVFLALSGFLVFLLTAHLYGADGRGTIAYGTSLFASVGILLSLSIGRVFIGKTLQDDLLKKSILPHFLVFNIAISLISSVVGFAYWFFSDSAQNILDIKQVLWFSLLSFYYVWFHNGHPFFSAFSQTKLQDSIIIFTRILLLVFLLLFWFVDIKDITIFIVGYAVVLSGGAIVEMFILKSTIGVNMSLHSSLSQWKSILKLSWWPHIDYIAFNIFPLIIMVLSATTLTKADLGKSNFAMQIISLVFLLSTTANLRIAAYIANFGFEKKKDQISKLLWYTFGASLFSSIIIFVILLEAKHFNFFTSFTGFADLFLILSFSIPGYLSYQFLNPIWIEMNQLKKSALMNTAAFLLCLALLPFMLDNWGVRGLAMIISFFYTLVLICNLIIWYSRSVRLRRSS